MSVQSPIVRGKPDGVKPKNETAQIQS